VSAEMSDFDTLRIVRLASRLALLASISWRALKIFAISGVDMGMDMNEDVDAVAFILICSYAYSDFFGNSFECTYVVYSIVICRSLSLWRRHICTIVI
jgi:hypothetical protein